MDRNQCSGWSGIRRIQQPLGGNRRDSSSNRWVASTILSATPSTDGRRRATVPFNERFDRLPWRIRRPRRELGDRRPSGRGKPIPLSQESDPRLSRFPIPGCDEARPAFASHATYCVAMIAEPELRVILKACARFHDFHRDRVGFGFRGRLPRQPLYEYLFAEVVSERFSERAQFPQLSFRAFGSHRLPFLKALMGNLKRENSLIAGSARDARGWRRALLSGVGNLNASLQEIGWPQSRHRMYHPSASCQGPACLCLWLQIHRLNAGCLFEVQSNGYGPAGGDELLRLRVRQANFCGRSLHAKHDKSLLPCCGRTISVLREPIRYDGPWPWWPTCPHSFTGHRRRVPLLDAEFFCSFSYIRGLDPQKRPIASFSRTNGRRRSDIDLRVSEARHNIEERSELVFSFNQKARLAGT